MAKKRKKSHRRRRRIGAIAMSASSPLVKYGSIAAGYLVADKVSEQVSKISGDIDPKIVNGILAAGGLYILFMHRGKKNVLLTALAGLAAGAGAKNLLTEFGVINGFAEIPTVGDIPVIGQYAVPQMSINGVGGYNVPSVMGSVPNAAMEDGSGINSTDR